MFFEYFRWRKWKKKAAEAMKKGDYTQYSYVRVFDPLTVLALLDRLEAAEAHVALDKAIHPMMEIR